VNNERPIYITLLLVLATLAFCSAFATAHTHDDVCDVVQASFVTLTKSQDPVYPRDIEPSSGSTMLEGIQTSSGSIMLKGIGSSPLAKMELREDEVSKRGYVLSRYDGSSLQLKRASFQQCDALGRRHVAAARRADALRPYQPPSRPRRGYLASIASPSAQRNCRRPFKTFGGPLSVPSPLPNARPIVTLMPRS
jgi:hypothetical protein